MKLWAEDKHISQKIDIKMSAGTTTAQQQKADSETDGHDEINHKTSKPSVRKKSS